MKEKTKELTINFTDFLRDKTKEFLLKNIDKEDLGEIISMLISAHFSNLYSFMNLISADGSRELKLKVFNFFEGLEVFFKTQGFVLEQSGKLEKCEI